MFSFESSQTVEFQTKKTQIQVYVLKDSDFRILFVGIPGPLVSCSIVIPTVCSDHKGLPHTLEHLVFCGSETIPHRGYLDNLATRCLSTGTNAYTAQDHTCYEITTAGSEGMMNVFPVFLDHILNPTLKPSQFMTEVYHMDHKGKHQGVVYCEMASRENTEPDLLDFHLRQMVYQLETTYAFECGGLTSDIQHLKNDEIIAYHKSFYHLNNCAAIICGPVNPTDFLDNLAKHVHLFEPKKVEIPQFSIHPSPWFQPDANLISKTVAFPSEDEDVGSIAYGWRGPPSEDLQTILALEVLFRYFNDNPSSLFPQKFVERSDPYATDVDFDTKAFVDSCIFLIFSGVPFSKKDSGDADMDAGETSEDDDDQMSEDDQSEASVEQRDDLFDEGVYYGLMRETILDFVTNGFKEENSIKDTIKRHRQKLLEELEDSPHESITELLIPDILRYFLANQYTMLIRSSAKDTKAQGGKPRIGARLQVFSVLDGLEKESNQFWISLAKKYLLENPVCEVMMTPDAALAKRIDEENTSAEKKRLKAMTATDISKIEEQVKFAIKDNEVNLSDSVLALMPRIPDVSKASSINYDMANVALGEESSLFSGAQVVFTDTAFCHYGFALHIGDLSEELRPYLVIFQELLFQSSLCIPGLNGDINMDYKEVAKYVSEVFVSHECGVGFGNSIFSVSYLGQLFTLFITCNPKDWDRAVRFAIQVFLYSEFQNERIISIGKNLITNIVDIKRDGSSVMAAVSNRVVCDPKQNAALGNNEGAISIFEQEEFLKKIVSLCEDGSDVVVKKLEKLRSVMLSNVTFLNFMRVAVPMKFQLRNRNVREFKEVSTECCRIWNAEFEKYDSAKLDKKRKLSDSTLPFPFPRVPFSLQHYDSKYSKSILVPVAGLNTCYLSQFVPCDLSKTHKDPDYFPTVLLAEILSRTEGPLYTGIRGQGHAYGASLNCFLWAGQLSFELYRTSEPKLALECFYDILKDLGTKKGFEKYCSDYEIQTAQASIAYRWASYGATPSSVISSALRTTLQGFKDLKEHSMFIQELYKVTRADLQRCYDKYFKLFFSENRVTILTTPTGDSIKAQQKSFQKIKKSQSDWYKVDFTIYNLKDFAL